MAPPPTVASLSDLSARELDFIFHHVFLPPQLPSAAEDAETLPDLEAALLTAIQKSLKAFALYCPAIKGTLDMTSDGLDRMFTTMTTAGVLSESMVAEELQNLCANHAAVLPLYIRSQNAGVLVASTNEGMVFEVFEISPCNAAVITTKGRLLRTFPGPAIVVGPETSHQPEFQTMLAYTLSKMSSQPVRGMQPKSQKAGASHDEDRDTTSPAAVTELVLSLLRASGETIELKNVSKSIRDEVFWEKGVEIPWRRSPIWMFARVFLHVTFSRTREHGENYYKAFLMFFMARVMETARRTSQHGEMLYCMTSKVMRRLHKLPPGVPPALRNVVCNTLSNAGQAISDTWKTIQDSLSHQLSLSALPSLNFAADCQVAIPDLDDYIVSSTVAVTPNRVAGPTLTTGAIQLRKDEIAPTLSFSPEDPYAIANLEEFETWVASGLAEIDLSADEFASKVNKGLVNYLQVAGKAYSGNAEALSIMVLTAVELWIACDKRSIKQCPLLSEYDPEIPSSLLESLVLPSKSQWIRLRVVEDYLTSRKKEACFTNEYLFQGPGDRRHGNDFAIRYYTRYDKERGLERFQNTLLQRAQQDRDAKILELENKRSQYIQMKRSWEQSTCDTKTVSILTQRGSVRVEQVHDEQACEKCALADRMNKLNIQVHEWPLPSDSDKAKAIIFELHVPIWFAHWRDITACLILDVFKARQSKTLPVTAGWSFYDDFHLQDHMSGGKHRVVLWSESKAQKKTHFKRKWLNKEPSVDEVCVENGLKYRYSDAYSKCFLTGFVTTQNLPKDCMYRLPSRAKALESFIYRPPSSANGPTPNSVISSQTVFPEHLKANEYAELASLPLGHRIQWMNILVQLRSPGVDWKKEETVMFVLQCIGQAGPPGTTAIRPGHETASRDDFAKQMLAALEECLEKVRENWESANALIVFSAVAWRLRMLNTTSKHIRDACVAFISNVIAVAFEWVQRLRTRSQEAATSADRTEFRTKTIELALICATCFSGDQEALITLSSNESLASAFFQCCMIISERVLRKATTEESIWSLLYLRFKRLLRQRYRILRHDFTGLDTAVARVWSIHQADLQGWTSAQGEKSHWLVAQLKPAHGDMMVVHYNLLTGEFLVDGARIQRLPRSYQDHPLYKTLFGTSDVEVLPCKVPGMRFSTTTTWDGFHVHLGWKDGDILVKAWREGQLYQLVPSRVLQGIYASSFQAKYIHWFNESTHTVEFRPAADPWKTSPTTWTLHAVSHHAWELSRGDTRVLGLRNRSAREISTALSPIAEPTTVHMTLDPNNRLEIELSETKTGFFLNAQSAQLYSREFPGMIVAEDQSLGTLIGFSNKLILKHENGTRRVLVLEGPVSYKRRLNHVEVTIDRARAGRVHDLEIDERLGVLKDRGSLQCKLFLALLHALTSYCLADPATRKTGTEQALTILRSAATRSFEYLNEHNIELLMAISRITPARSYYPSKDVRPMQSVDWDPDLSSLSQHGGLYKAVEAILEQAEQSSVFFADSQKVPTLDHAEPQLLERDLIRSSTFRVDGFGAEYFSSGHDLEYRGRDRDQDSDRAINAFIVSSIVFGKKDKLHWNAPARSKLWQLAQSVSTVYGPLEALDEQTLRFDSGLLEGSGEQLIRVMPMLHAALKNAGEHKINRFDLAMWLSSMAFGIEPRLEVIQAVALMFTVPSLRRLEIPRVKSWSLADGHTINYDIKVKLIKEVLENAVVDFSNSPAVKIPRKPDQSEQAAQESRVHKYDLCIKNAAKAVVESRWKSWDQVGANTNTRIGLEHLPYLKRQEADHIISTKFQVLRDNEALQSYLYQVEMSLSEFRQEEQDPPFWKQAPELSWHEYECGYFSVDDLFSKVAPNLPSALPVLPLVDELVANVSAQEADHQCSLAKLVGRFERIATTYEQDYLKDLRKSAKSLGIHRASQRSAQGVPACDVLETFRNRSYEHLEHVQSELNQAMTAACVSRLLDCNEIDTATIQGHKFTVHHLPRVSPVFILGQLNRQRWSKLSPAWQTCIVQYALATTTLQRAERLLVAHSTPGWPGLLRELANPGHTNWSPFEYPETLLLEAEANILVRDVQEQIASEMRSPPRFTQNAVLQLSMGEGKSSVIVPMVAAALANTSQLVRVVVAKPQSKQMAQMLVSKLGGLLNRRLFFMPFSRAVKLTKSKIKALERLCKECMAEGGVMLLQPEHIMSFKLMGPELLINDNAELGRDVLRIHDWLDMNSRDVIDECDDILDVHNELIYTMGAQRPIEMTPLRWTCIQQVLDLVKLHASNLASSSGLEFQDRGTGCFPRIRFLDHETGDEIMRRVARQVCDEGLRGFPAPHQTSAARESLYTYITHYELSKDQIQAVENGPLWSSQFRSILLLLRGLFATDILAFVFGRKRWRVNYGITNREPPTRLAVPYRAKDCPTMRSEFSHPDVVILLTSLSYYYGGLNDEQLFLTMVHLKKADAQGEYRSWTAATSLPKEFCHLDGVNLSEKAACTSVVFPQLRKVKGAIDFFLSHVVFPKEMREFPNKMSASGWDLGKVKRLPTTGFSGTNDSKDLLPLDVTHLDLKEQAHTNALVLGNLLHEDNSVALMGPADESSGSTDAERLLDMVVNLPDSPDVILDVGAQILELDNLAVASAWLAKRRNKKAAIYCNENDELTVVDRKGDSEPFQTSSFVARTDECLVYLDEAHTRGIDIKLPSYYRAACTLGANLTKDRICQAAMRMRQLGQGQSVVLCVSNEIRSKILACTNKHPETAIEVIDVLHWAIAESFAWLRRSIALWTTQGHRFVLQESLWRDVCIGGKDSTALTPGQAQKFLEPEARSISFRYRPGRAFEDQLKKLEDQVAQFAEPTQSRLRSVIDHCKRFGRAEQGSRRLQEEQERELSPEVEEEAVVERALPAAPARHEFSKDLRKLVQTGRILPGGSAAYGPAFASLRDTSAAREFNPAVLDTKCGLRLLVTADFARTVEKQPGSPHTSDAFQRHVQWILTIRKDPRDLLADAAIMLSPFEAHMLLDDVRRSEYAALHLYKPRCSEAHPALDRLDLYTISKATTKPVLPRQLSAALNVFAGQIYFDSYEEYQETCRFLGLASEKARPEWKVTGNGFILSDGTASGEKTQRQNPVDFLKVLLMKVRRNVEFDKSHMARVLEGDLLVPTEFESR
ncbi:Hypothetical predicted protein [Lecanosticta acicola]|uniref:ubiquitinyl hydrolase 1 n=1 Tax=Lecanosticta acicola TaxID=111012 RepID=A0AAI8Z7M4_9PEZI|nr:Hypothetical predicted protein [Lecanosticta acicola]